MDKRISGLIRHFDGLASPSYVPQTPLPRDPGKSASLPLAEALSIVEPGATATLLLLLLLLPKTLQLLAGPSVVSRAEVRGSTQTCSVFVFTIACFV